MELIAQRTLDGLEAARLYTQAYEAPPKEALSLLPRVETLVKKNRDAYASLGQQFKSLWLAESKPYALDWTLDRYADAVKRYDDLAGRLAEARKKESFTRRGRPHETLDTPLEPDAPWTDASATHRVGVVVRAGSVDRHELPVAVHVRLPEGLASKPLRAFCLSGSQPKEILAQLDPSKEPTRTRLTMLIPGPIAKGGEASVHVYLGLCDTPKPLTQAVSTKDGPDGMKWIENDKVRLLLGPEGGHVYKWEVKALEGRDLTVPGQSGWSGFADMRSYRHVLHQLRCVADGPALVRCECTTEDGLVKSIGLFGGVSWMEVVLNEPTGHYWDFDTPTNFAADGPTPGTYLFSNGTTGPVAGQGPFTETQVKAQKVHWCMKYNADGLALGIVTPEVAANHVIAPGAGSGGVGIESSPLAGHFVTFAGLLEAEPAETMNRLRDTLNFKNQPQVILYAVQARE